MKPPNRNRIETLGVVAALVLTGCGKKERAEAPGKPPSTLEKVTEEVKGAVSLTKELLVEQKEKLQKNLSSRMVEFDKQFEELKRISRQASDRTKSELTNTVANLQQKKDAAAQKLRQLKSSSAEAWQEVKAGAEKAFAELEKGFKEAYARFKHEQTPQPR